MGGREVREGENAFFVLEDQNKKSFPLEESERLGFRLSTDL
jgi:hypothetical protein